MTQTSPSPTTTDHISPDRGMNLQVLRPADGVDCTLNGITSKAARVICVGVVDCRDGYSPDEVHTSRIPAEMRLWDASPTAPAVLLQVRRIGGIVLSLIPAEWDGDKWVKASEQIGFYCAGGNYATTTDSRFGDLTALYSGARFYGALSVHDRLESYPR